MLTALTSLALSTSLSASADAKDASMEDGACLAALCPLTRLASLDASGCGRAATDLGLLGMHAALEGVTRLNLAWTAVGLLPLTANVEVNYISNVVLRGEKGRCLSHFWSVKFQRSSTCSTAR